VADLEEEMIMVEAALAVEVVDQVEEEQGTLRVPQLKVLFLLVVGGALKMALQV
jgi:hypothetical protein